MWRTLVQTSRVILLEARMPLRFWAQAMSTAAYLRNRTWSSSASAGKGGLPFAALTGVTPDISNLRVFGCRAYVSIPKERRQDGKFCSSCLLWCVHGIL